MRISVITCTWNSERFLRESIQSVLAQDHGEIEYIFVDGGSTDATLEIITGASRPYHLIRDVRGGVSRAMNAGAAVATGDVIAHLHSDDYYADARVLSRVGHAFAAHPGSQWLVGQMVVDCAGVLSAPTPAQRFSYGRFARGAFGVGHPACFVRRSAFAAAGAFDESLKYAMDWDLWYRLASRSVPVVVPEVLAVWREHQGSLSGGDPASKISALRELGAVHRRYASRAPISHLVCWLRYRRRLLRLNRELNRN